MPKNIPSLKPKELINTDSKNVCGRYPTRLTAPSPCQGEGWGGVLSMCCIIFSNWYILRICRQFSFTDEEIENILS